MLKKLPNWDELGKVVDVGKVVGVGKWLQSCAAVEQV